MMKLQNVCVNYKNEVLNGDIMKSEEIARRQFSDRGQSWFSKKYACWANNHNGWSKMKKKNRKLFKKKFRRETEKEILNELNDLNI